MTVFRNARSTGLIRMFFYSRGGLAGILQAYVYSKGAFVCAPISIERRLLACDQNRSVDFLVNHSVSAGFQPTKGANAFCGSDALLCQADIRLSYLVLEKT